MALLIVFQDEKKDDPRLSDLHSEEVEIKALKAAEMVCVASVCMCVIQETD